MCLIAVKPHLFAAFPAISVVLPLNPLNVALDAQRCIHNPTCICQCLGLYTGMVYVIPHVASVIGAPVMLLLVCRLLVLLHVCLWASSTSIGSSDILCQFPFSVQSVSLLCTYFKNYCFPNSFFVLYVYIYIIIIRQYFLLYYTL